MKKIAKLAMLSQEDALKVKDEIENIKEMAKVLDELKPEKQTSDLEQSLRLDEAAESLKSEAVFMNAPLSEDGYFLVPKTVGE